MSFLPLANAAQTSPRCRIAAIADTRALNLETRTVELSFSSDAPVEMGWETEILSHASGAVDLSRLNQAAPLLFNHQRDDLLGVVESVRIRSGKGYATVRFGRDERGEWAMQQVADGILVNVSMMYVVEKYEEDEKSNTVTALRWTPYEISLVTIPADITVGVGRSRPYTIEPPAQNASTSGAPTMNDIENGAPDNHGASQQTPEAQQRGVDIQVNDSGLLERARISTITKLCDEHKIPAKQRDAWIANGTGTDAVGQSILEVLKERHVSHANSAAYLDLDPKDRKRYSLFAMINAVNSRDFKKAGLELECHKAIAAKNPHLIPGERSFYLPVDIQHRDLTVATPSAGGYLVETQNMSFIELLRNQSVLMAMGATRLSGLTGNVNIPKQTGAETAVWLANEASTITESALTLGQLALTPKTVGGYTELSRLLTLQSSPSAEALVMASLARTIALAVDAAGINGAGSGGEPQGIIGTSGVGSVTGTSLAYADIIEFQTDVAASNALSDASGYVTTPAIAGLLKERVKFSGTASPIWEGKLLSGSVDGYRAMASNQMPTANMLFGDFSQVIIGEWGMLEVEVNPFANFQAAISGIRAIYTVDVGVRIPAAFSLATSIT